MAYEKRFDWCIGVWVGTWNKGSLSEKEEVGEEMRMKMIDVLVCR